MVDTKKNCVTRRLYYILVMCSKYNHHSKSTFNAIRRAFVII